LLQSRDASIIHVSPRLALSLLRSILNHFV
jgi:hypothetical protein